MRRIPAVLAIFVLVVASTGLSLFWAAPANATSPYTTERSGYNGRCLDADLNTMGTNGGKVQLWDCNGQPQQSWTPLRDATIRSANARCLDADLNRIGFNGVKVQLWDCNGQPQQRWFLQEDGSIRSGYNGRCLDADLATLGANGTKIQLWDCNGQIQQKWTTE
ncbi:MULTISPECIES: RICIN domain-containing protein [Amycolatopsis]|uniref:Ricin-type beta-trefoil lectin domain-containing protein n=2 Tax=Amycolatopsis TaxID=1813 RepID=A0A1I3L0S6_9PSEU|nr:RICIN domain-containing protein [Amycolatopsis sacchari]SFI78300.1 Ricin-type beta-trefoil lectin domain-containing protein [Amycolatopsis sacchari]